MLLKQILEIRPELLKDNLDVKKTWTEVFGQAVKTTRRGGIAETIKERRPGESTSIKDHRIKNTPQHAKSVFDNTLSKISRIVRNSSLKVEGGSENIKTHLGKNPFDYLSTKVSFEEWFWRCVFPYSCEDPNGLIIPFPRSINNYFAAPALPVDLGGNPTDEPVKIEHKIVTYKEIYILSRWLLKIFGGKEKYTSRNSKEEREFYFVADSQFWYKCYPSWNGKKWVDNYSEWYEHGTGVVPINILPGKFSTDLQGNKYQESFYRPFYEFADDHASTYSDNVANRVLSFYPKAIMAQIDCTTCEGSGQIENKRDGKITGHVECKVCHGSRYVKDIGSYEALTVPNPDMSDIDVSKYVSYIQPPIEATREGYTMAFDLLDRGGKAMGIDVLIDSAESGEAMRQRMEKTTDFLTDVAETCAQTMRRHLIFTDALLNKKPKDRKDPVIIIPQSFEIKNEEILINDAKNALEPDAVNRHLDYYGVIYKDDPVMFRIMQLAYNFCPELALNKDQLDRCERRGQLKDYDFAKLKFSVWAFTKLSIDPNFLDQSEDILFKGADEMINERADIIKVDPLIDPNGEITSQRSSLLETVGGVTGIIQISSAVANGTMTERAAEKLLVEVFGFNKDVAESLIDTDIKVPNNE